MEEMVEEEEERVEAKMEDEVEREQMERIIAQL